MPRPSFEEAKSRFVHRFTMEYRPYWASRAAPNGKFYAPQFHSDREWYESTKFHGEDGHIGGRRECTTSGQTWPLGQWLDRAYSIHSKYQFMRVPESSSPQVFRCVDCSRRVNQAHEVVWADIKGRAYEAYYCGVCKGTAAHAEALAAGLVFPATLQVASC